MDFWYNSLALPYTPKYRAIFDKYNPRGIKVSNGESLALSHGAVMANYLMHKEIYTHSVTYEEMMRDIELETKRLFSKLDVPEAFVNQAITALNKHSQNNIFGPNVNNEDVMFPKGTGWDLAESIFKELDVPLSVAMSLEELLALMH